MRCAGHITCAVVVMAVFTAACAVAPGCTATPDPGPCRAFFRRFFWDAAEAACEPFIYGGCGGTVPFRTATECEAAACGAEKASPAPPREAVLGYGANAEEWAAKGAAEERASRGAKRAQRVVSFRARTVVG